MRLDGMILNRRNIALIMMVASDEEMMCMQMNRTHLISPVCLDMEILFFMLQNGLIFGNS